MRPHLSASPPLDPHFPVVATPPPRRLARTLASAALVLALMAPLALLTRELGREFAALREDERAVAAGAVIGFRNVHPVVSRAAPPSPFHRREGGDLLVWSGWKDGEGHRWFKLAAGDCDPATLSDPIGRDVARAIDDPELETTGGEIWGRMPEGADVVGFATGGTTRAYPRLVLNKVLVVNDVVDGRPCLVHLDPFPGRSPDVAVYDAQVDGRRITLGSCGFTMGRRHVLYDRGTESLWVDQGDRLEAFSGRLKGKRLALVCRLSTSTWGDWRSENPDTRLLVGAFQAPTTLAAE